MKFNSILTGLCLLAVGFSSCNLETDNENNFVTNTYSCCNLVIPADDAPFATRNSYTIKVYPFAQNATITSTDLSLGYGVGSFTTGTMPIADNVYTIDGSNQAVSFFSGGFANENGLLIENMNGFISTLIYSLSAGYPNLTGFQFTPRISFVASYTVNHDFTVKTFMPDAVYVGTTNVTSAGVSSSPQDQKEARYRVVFSEDMKKASVIIYELGLNENTPLGYGLLLRDLPVTYTKYGYEIKGINFVAETFGNYTGESSFEFKNFTFTNNSSDLTECGIFFNIQHGDDIYNGTFQGAYVRSKID